jgi:hypothetical protein
VEIKYNMKKYSWIISLTIGLVLLVIGLVMKNSPFPFFILIGFMLITFGIFISVFGVIEKLIK